MQLFRVVDSFVFLRKFFLSGVALSFVVPSYNFSPKKIRGEGVANAAYKICRYFVSYTGSILVNNSASKSDIPHPSVQKILKVVIYKQQAKVRTPRHKQYKQQSDTSVKVTSSIPDIKIEKGGGEQVTFDQIIDIFSRK